MLKIGITRIRAACVSLIESLLEALPLLTPDGHKKRIILVQMSYPSSPFPGPNLPVGLGYIAEQLELHGIGYDFSDLSVETKKELFRKISKYAPEYVGLSLMSLDIDRHYALAEEIKSLFPDVRVVAGGAHISFAQAKALEECPAIDIGVVYEGEQTLVELLNGRTYGTIRGLLYRDQAGSIIYTGMRDLSDDLDQFHFPRFRRFQLSSYSRQISLASSRGCPFSCTFCGAHLSMGKKWRSRSVSSMVAELEYWCGKGYKEFNFIDSNFFMSKQRILDLCDSLENRHIKIALSSDGMRANDADRSMLMKLKKIGLQRVAIGVESANDDILRSIKKGETVADLEACLELLAELDIEAVAFFIIGLPGETVQHVLNSFMFALKYPNISQAYFFNPNPLPGTELHALAHEQKILTATESEIYENIGGMGNKILLETPELHSTERIVLSEFSKHVSRMVELNFIRKDEKKASEPVSHVDEAQEINSQFNRCISMLKTTGKTNKIFFTSLT